MISLKEVLWQVVQSHSEKSADKNYMEKYAKNGNLITTAEQFYSGTYEVSDISTKKKWISLKVV